MCHCIFFRINPRADVYYKTPCIALSRDKDHLKLTVITTNYNEVSELYILHDSNSFNNSREYIKPSLSENWGRVIYHGVGIGTYF